MDSLLGFRIVQTGEGSWRIEVLNEEGKVTGVRPVLYKEIWGRIQLIKGLPAKDMAEQAAPPPTASLLFGRWFGGSEKGLKAVEDYDRERSHTYALQRAMREKKCVNVDVDLELAEVIAEMSRIRRN